MALDASNAQSILTLILTHIIASTVPKIGTIILRPNSAAALTIHFGMELRAFNATILNILIMHLKNAGTVRKINIMIYLSCFALTVHPTNLNTMDKLVCHVTNTRIGIFN